MQYSSRIMIPILNVFLQFKLEMLYDTYSIYNHTIHMNDLSLVLVMYWSIGEVVKVDLYHCGCYYYLFVLSVVRKKWYKITKCWQELNKKLTQIQKWTKSWQKINKQLTKSAQTLDKNLTSCEHKDDKKWTKI